MKLYLLLLTLLMAVLCLISPGLQNKVIFSNYGTIKEVNLHTGRLSYLLTNLQSDIHSMDYDYKNRYMYFQRYQKNDISRFRYPSEQTYTFETVTVADKPFGMAIDPLHSHVYWTEFSTSRLYRCNLDGSNKLLILQDAQTLFALKLDFKNRWLYYSTFVPTKLRRSRLDGNGIHTLVQGILGRVVGLSIDYNQDRLYWMEDSSGGLKSSNFDGTNVITVFTTNKTSTNYGIDVHGSKVYCANYNRLLNVTVSPAIKANAIYTDTEEIVAVLFFNEKLVLACLTEHYSENQIGKAVLQ